MCVHCIYLGGSVKTHMLGHQPKPRIEFSDHRWGSSVRCTEGSWPQVAGEVTSDVTFHFKVGRVFEYLEMFGEAKGCLENLWG